MRRAKLDANQRLMLELGFQGTPAILFRDADGTAHYLTLGCGLSATQGAMISRAVSSSSCSHSDAPTGCPTAASTELEDTLNIYNWAAYLNPKTRKAFEDEYGVSTTPTYVMIDRDGKVSTYLPGQPTMEQLDALVQKIVAPATSSSQR